MTHQQLYFITLKIRFCDCNFVEFVSVIDSHKIMIVNNNSHKGKIVTNLNIYDCWRQSQILDYVVIVYGSQK